MNHNKKSRKQKGKNSDAKFQGLTGYGTKVPHPMQMFPDRLRTVAKTIVNYGVSINPGAGNNGNFWFQKIANCLNTNNYNVNLGGYSGTIAPSGISYLLGDSNQGGSNAGGNAPYYNYRVYKSRVRVRFLGLPNLAGANAILTVVPLLGYASSVFAGMSNTQVCEQPYAKWMLINALPYGPVPTVVNQMSSLELYGDKFKSTLESGQYDGNWNSAPSNQWQWLIALQTMAATVANYTLIGTVVVEIEDDVEFFSRNTYIAAPGS